MKKILTACLTLAVFLLTWDVQAQLTAEQILDKAEKKARGDNALGEIKMTIIRPTWKREMRMKTWAKGDDYSLILLLAPAKEKGISFLKRKREMWNWQPSIDRNVKMPPSMMMQSWMGSDFTNDDLVKESSMVRDYEQKLLGKETISGRVCHKIQLIPKEEAAVVWGKILIWVSEKDYLQLKTEFYDEDDYLVNTLKASNIKKLGGRLLPAKLEMIPAEEEGHKTILEYISLDFDKKLEDRFFSIQNMKRLR